jgi:hypothetical protein
MDVLIEVPNWTRYIRLFLNLFCMMKLYKVPNSTFFGLFPKIKICIFPLINVSTKIKRINVRYWWKLIVFSVFLQFFMVKLSEVLNWTFQKIKKLLSIYQVMNLVSFGFVQERNKLLSIMNLCVYSYKCAIKIESCCKFFFMTKLHLRSPEAGFLWLIPRRTSILKFYLFKCHWKMLAKINNHDRLAIVVIGFSSW